MDFERLDRLLRERGISRRKLAQEVDINENTMGTAFKRKSGLGSDDVLRIAKYLEVSPYYLEGYDVTATPLQKLPGYLIAEVTKDGQRIGETRIIPSDMADEEIIEEVLDDEEIQIREFKRETLSPTVARILNAMELLNKQGQFEAVKRVEELTEIPRYTKPDDEQGD